MSNQENIKAICHNCQAENTITVHRLIDASAEPELVQMVIDNSIVMIECSSCNKQFFFPFDFVYNDPVRKFLMIHFSSQIDKNKIDQILEELRSSSVNPSDDYLNHEFFVVNWMFFNFFIRSNIAVSKTLSREKEKVQKILNEDKIEYFTYLRRNNHLEMHSDFRSFITKLPATSEIRKTINEMYSEELNSSLNNLEKYERLYRSVLSVQGERNPYIRSLYKDPPSILEDSLITADQSPLKIEVFDLTMNRFRSLDPWPDAEKLGNFLALRILDVGEWNKSSKPHRGIEGLTFLKYKGFSELKEGFIFKASILEDRFDVYFHNNAIYFYCAIEGHCLLTANVIKQDEINPSFAGDPIEDGFVVTTYYIAEQFSIFAEGLDEALVDFMIKTYVLGKIAPCPLPQRCKGDFERMLNFAFYIFSNKALYGSFENTLGIACNESDILAVQ
jgi:hypothetical protein